MKTEFGCVTKPTCLGELAASELSPRKAFLRQPPACDYAEARIWDLLGGGWQSLYGCFCECGVAAEWHDFACAEPRDWSRSFHPDSVEICLNLTGHARLARGSDMALLGPSVAAVYSIGSGSLAAWRLPGERHRFLTLEYSRAYLGRQLAHRQTAVAARLREVVCGASPDAPAAVVFGLTPSLRRAADTLRAPPVLGPGQALWYQAKALEILAEVLFAPEEVPAPSPPRRAEVSRLRAEAAVRILSRRLADPPTLKELGREVGCSAYHLSRIFSREMGLTIPQYLRQVRMERAAELLKSGKFNVTEAALEVGYSSLSHFSQAFSETIGCCPGLYPLGLTRMANLRQ